MKTLFRPLLSRMAMAACALVLMGASGPLNNSVTSSISSTAASTVTSSVTASAISRPTNSIASRASGTLASRPTASAISRPTTSLSSRTTTSLAPSLTSNVTASVISGASGTPVVLSPYAEEVARIIKFDRQVLIMVKEITHDRIGRLIGFDADNYQIIAPGIVVSVPEENTDQVLAALRQKLVPLHYMPFVVEMNAGIKMDKIGVLKGTDQYEILRVMHTDGDEYDISNQDVIDHLKEWEYVSQFEIIGADSDWVEIEFKTLPVDLKAFAEDVYDFSPDAVDQGAGSVEGLIKEIRKTNRLFLWWD
jgi:hypothetical protein